jgi:hypothetical protein
MELHHRAMEAKRKVLEDNDNDDETMRSTQGTNGNTLLTWHQLPAWMHDNQYITNSYRRPTGSYKECAKTLFYFHNEYGKRKRDRGAIDKLMCTFSEHLDAPPWLPLVSWSWYPLSLVTLFL